MDLAPMTVVSYLHWDVESLVSEGLGGIAHPRFLVAHDDGNGLGRPVNLVDAGVERKRRYEA